MYLLTLPVHPTSFHFCLFSLTLFSRKLRRLDSFWEHMLQWLHKFSEQGVSTRPFLALLRTPSIQTSFRPFYTAFFFRLVLTVRIDCYRVLMSFQVVSYYHSSKSWHCSTRICLCQCLLRRTTGLLSQVFCCAFFRLVFVVILSLSHTHYTLKPLTCNT